jgi:hypothetical protein
VVLGGRRHPRTYNRPEDVVTEALRGYYDQSYPPSVLHPGPTPLTVQLGTGWVAGQAPTGATVSILVWDGEQAVLAPTQVDWGDGSRNTSLTHIYVATAGPLHIVVTANGKAGTSVAFNVVEGGGTGTTGQPPDEPCPDDEPAPEPEPKKAAKK